MRFFGAALLLAAAAGPSRAQGLTEVRFGTNWLAEAEHGGFYQALADGTYERYGLKVTIVQGGPQAPNRALLLAGRIDFYMAGNMLLPFNAAAEDIPLVEVATIFQKDPQVLIAHPDQGIERFEDLATLDTIFMGNEIYASAFRWMKSEFPGFRDEQFRPYTFNPAPFLADKRSAQQGYATSEPFAIREVGGFEPKVFLLADYGFDTPSTMIEAKRDYVAANPDVVQRFVDASIVGWYTYLYRDPALGNALIKQENPEMTDAQIDFTISKMLEYGLVDSGIATTQGIGCFDGAQVQSFYDKMVAADVIEAGIDVAALYTNQFVCKGVGLDLRP